MPAVLTASKVNTDIRKGLAEILSARLKALDINSAIKNAAMAHQNEIADLNTEQLNRGQKAGGGTTGVYANFGYKGRLSPVDLYDTGDLHKSIKPRISVKQVELVATDAKIDELQDRYGDDILGLTDANVTEAGQIIKRSLISEVKKQL